MCTVHPLFCVYNEGVHDVDRWQEFADVSSEIQLASFVHLAWHDAVVYPEVALSSSLRLVHAMSSTDA